MTFISVLRFEFALIKRISTRGFSATSNVSPWDVVAGVCVERLPVVTAPLHDIQKRYKEFLSTIEIEKSLKSDHELRHESDKLQAEMLKKNADVDLDAASKITAQDFEDSSNEELTQLKLAPIETEADKKNDTTSLERSLQRHLVLVKQMKLGNDVKTLLPQGVLKEGETLRQAAERVLAEQCGKELQVQFLSNAPCGFYKYKYPSAINGKVGAKVFFYYANHKSGTPNATDKQVQWLTRKELDSILPERYKKSVTDFLIDETY